MCPANKTEKKSSPKKKEVDYNQGITSITIQGFKSLVDEWTVDIRPLTILAGANSSGKSSVMQPLLLLKQTLEASFDPGPLVIYGSHVKFDKAEQFFSKIPSRKITNIFSISFTCNNESSVKSIFKAEKKGIDLIETVYRHKDRILSVKINNLKEIEEYGKYLFKKEPPFTLSPPKNKSYKYDFNIDIVRNKCFLRVVSNSSGASESHINTAFLLGMLPSSIKIHLLVNYIFHLPGLRGKPQRAYNKTASGPLFPGLFTEYFASIILHWQETKDPRLKKLGRQLERIGLTWKVEASQLNEAQTELRVGRLPKSQRGGLKDLVNISDVGIGVSQSLPILVALLTAEPGQLVYLEQPELHLHPDAQLAMAGVIAEASKRGVRVVVETHSAIFLLGIQTLVAEGTLSPELVKLHWFQRQKDGSSKIFSHDLDENGAFGDWPEDFAEIALEAESRYLTSSMK